MSKTVDGVTTSHIWDGTNIAGDVTNDTVTKYIRGLQLISAKTGSVESFYNYNGHGDVVQLTNGSGSITKRYSYDAFGVEQNKSDYDTNPFRYCGEYYDNESGLVYLRNRYYDGRDGRFITEDPVKDGLNWYVYANNNPVMFVDPQGLINEFVDKGMEFIKNTEKVDKQGVQILYWYLFGNGKNHFIDDDPEWSEYMKSNVKLSNDIKNILLSEFNNLDCNSSRWLDLTTHIDIENGENIVGYEYLHGTNSDLQHYKELGATVDDVDFRIIGSISKDSNGAVKYSLVYEWNDIIDPNPIYTTDIEKSEFAKTIPLANPKEYILRIKWTSNGVYNPNIGYKQPGWPIGYF